MSWETARPGTTPATSPAAVAGKAPDASGGAIPAPATAFKIASPGLAWSGKITDGGSGPMRYISKSRFMAGWQCLKRLYLEVHQPELAAEPDERTQAVLEQGQEVGRLAQTMFPGGTLIGAGQDELAKALALTAEAAKGAAPALFEAAFEHDGVLVRTDVLERRSAGEWRLIEVKSATDVKEHYVLDVAVQRLVLERCGLKVLPCLMHLNRAYVYDGKRYDLESLFRIRDLSNETAALAQDVRDLLRDERRMLARPQAPPIAPGRQCGSPVLCEFFDYCNPKLPDDHVANLPGLSYQKLRELTGSGVERMGDLPPGFTLTEKQARARECVMSGKAWFGKGLKASLAGLEYPLHFMDFETLAPALPRFAGMRPYENIPFQWSLHIRRKPGAAVEHREFLADNADDPRAPFLDSLRQAIEPKGTIVVYNRGFEAGCLTRLAAWCPGHEAEVGEIQSRLWDLLALMRANVYHPAFRGSFSLKSVLPALVPEMRYDGMAVSEGTQAGLAWERMIRGQENAAERNRWREALLAYCRQDTLAMVRLLDVIGAR